MGEFKNHLYDGVGSYSQSNGNKYEGGWFEGLKHGRGKFYNKTKGGHFDGEYKNGKK